MQTDPVEGIVDDQLGGLGAVSAAEVTRAGQPDPVVRTLVERIEIVDHRLAQEGSVVSAQDRPVGPAVLFTAAAERGPDLVGLEGGVGAGQSGVTSGSAKAAQ